MNEELDTNKSRIVIPEITRLMLESSKLVSIKQASSE